MARYNSQQAFLDLGLAQKRARTRLLTWRDIDHAIRIHRAAMRYGLRHGFIDPTYSMTGGGGEVSKRRFARFGPATSTTLTIGPDKAINIQRTPLQYRDRDQIVFRHDFPSLKIATVKPFKVKGRHFARPTS